jgi:predicted nuclease with TOPRIM domain
MRTSSVKEIESALTRLSLEDLQAVRDWLDDFIEDQLEVSDEFNAKIQRAKQEIAEGVYARTRKPDAGA